MKKLNVVLLFVFLLVSCSPNVTVVPTSIPTQTFTETPTSTSVPTSTPTITPTPLPITFIYQDDVPESAKRTQEKASYESYIYYSKYAQLGKITVYTFSDLEQYIDEVHPALQADVPFFTKSEFRNSWSNMGGTSASNGLVVANSGFFVWTSENQCYKAHNIGHEMFHVVQSKLMNHGLFRPALDYGPEWLKEGSAEIMTIRATSKTVNCTFNINQWKRDAEGGAAIEKYDEQIGLPNFWDVSPLAVHYLLEISPNDEASLIQFYLEIGEGKTWRNAFQSSFGLSVEDFYIKFEEYMNN